MLTVTLPDDLGGLLIDAAGTLIEPVPRVADAYAEAARRQGVAIDRELVKARFRRHFGEDEIDEQRGPLATDEATELRRWRRIVGLVLPEVPDPNRAFSELWDHFARPDAWRPFADVAPAVDALANSGLKVAIGSNFDGRLRGILRGHADLAGLVDAVVISSEVGRRKPHPEFYLAGCERLGLPPGRVLAIGDDLENDVLGPRRAGLTSAWVDRDGRRSEGHPPAWPDLATLVGAILGRRSD